MFDGGWWNCWIIIVYLHICTNNLIVIKYITFHLLLTCRPCFSYIVTNISYISYIITNIGEIPKVLTFPSCRIFLEFLYIFRWISFSVWLLLGLFVIGDISLTCHGFHYHTNFSWWIGKTVLISIDKKWSYKINFIYMYMYIYRVDLNIVCKYMYLQTWY